MKIKHLLLAGFIVLSSMMGVIAMPVQDTYATVKCPAGSKAGKDAERNTYADCNLDTAGDHASSAVMNRINIAINVVLGVVGVVAVAMIIMGGIQYTTSQGDAAKTTKARNTILYSIVGLVIALLAFAIVNFVLTGVFG